MGTVVLLTELRKTNQGPTWPQGNKYQTQLVKKPTLTKGKRHLLSRCSVQKSSLPFTEWNIRMKTIARRDRRLLRCIFVVLQGTIFIAVVIVVDVWKREFEFAITDEDLLSNFNGKKWMFFQCFFAKVVLLLKDWQYSLYFWFGE